MSSKFTEVCVANQDQGFWGHVAPEQAIKEAKRFWEFERDQAIQALEAIERGEVEVYHQLGPDAAKNRKKVYP